MPARYGTGPISEGRGRGRGRCGWGQRRRCGGGAGMGGGLRGKRHGQASDISTAKESEKGEQPSGESAFLWLSTAGSIAL